MPIAEARPRLIRFSAMVLTAVMAFALSLVFVAPAAAVTASNVTVSVATKTGLALPGVIVTAVPIANHDYDPTGTLVTGVAVVGKPGSFALTGLQSDRDYALYFSQATAGTFDQFYGGTTQIVDATYLQWTSGSHTLAVSLATNAVLSGRVTGPTGLAVNKATAYAYRFVGSGWEYAGEAKTNAYGNYAISNLDPGSYRVEFEPAIGQNLLNEFSGNKTTFETATATYIGLGATGVVSASLATGGVLTGLITWTNPYYGYGGAADHVVAYAYKLNGPDTGSGFPGINWDAPIRQSLSTSTTGRWTIAGLLPGSYVVKFYDDGYYWEYPLSSRWANSVLTPEEAAIFTVTAGRTTSAPTSVLPERNYDPVAANFAVEIRNTSNVLISNAHVIMFSSDNGDYYYEGTVAGWIDLNPIDFGTYTISIAAPGYQTYVGSASVTHGGGNYPATIHLQPASAFNFTSAPTATGPDLKVGTTFAVNAQTTLDDGVGAEVDVEYSFQWMRDNQPIFGATGSEYTAQSSDFGTNLTVRVRAIQTETRYHNTDAYIVAYASVGIIEEGAAPTPNSTPIISGPATIVPGSTLTANSGTWSVSGVKLSYEWMRDGSPIPGATARTYVVLPTDVNTAISVLVTASKPGHASNAVSSGTVVVNYLAAPLKVIAPTVAAALGAPVGSQRYTVNKGTWNVPLLTYQYQWFAQGVPIPGATAASYDLNKTGPYAGQVLEVELTVSKQGYLAAVKRLVALKGSLASVVSSISIVDDTAGFATVNSVTVTEIGHVLHAQPVVTYPSDGGGTLTRIYQWQRSPNGTTSWVSIVGATSATFTLGVADVGKFVRVVSVAKSTLFADLSQIADGGSGTARTELSGAGGAAPTVTIVGSSHVATPHKARVDSAWPVPAVTLAYKWYTCTTTCDDTSASNPNWVAVPLATTVAWTPPVAMSGRLALVQVTASKIGYLPLAVRSGVITLSTSNQIENLTPPTVAVGLVTGSAVVGRLITATAGTFDVASTLRTYQWQSCDSSVDDCAAGVGWNNIPLATTIGFTPKGALWLSAAMRLRVVETASRVGYLPQSAVSNSFGLVQGTLVASVIPKVTVLAGTYTATAGTWLPAGAVSTYEWQLDGVPVAVGATYTPPVSTEAVHVVVTTTLSGYVSKVTTVVARKGAAPVASVSAIVGSTYPDVLTAPNPFTYPATSTPAAVRSFQWYSNGVAILGATGATFAPSSAYVGRNITVRVISKSPFYLDTLAYVTAPVTYAKAPSASGSIAISSTLGSYVPGAKLSVGLTGWSTTGLVYTYGWQFSPNGTTWTTVGTASTYTLLPAQAGGFLRVTVTAKKAGYFDTVTVVGPDPIYFSTPLATTALPALSGDGLVGRPLTLSTGTWNTPTLTFTYAWLRDGVVIPGVTGTTFTPLASYLGEEITAIVTASRPGYMPVTVQSNAITIGTGLAPIATVAPTITGLAKVGVVLKASTGVWNTDGLTFEFEWRANGVPIVGATEREFTVTGAEVGTTLSVRVIATRIGYTNGQAIKSFATLTIA